MVSVQLLVVVVIGAGALGYVQMRSDPELLLKPLSALLVATALWSIGSWRASGGQWFDPYTLFLTAAVLFNGGFAALELLVPDSRLRESSIFHLFEPELVLLILWVLLLGLGAMHLGALMAQLRQRHVPPRQDHDSEEIDTALRQAGWLLIAVSTGPTLVVLGQLLKVVMSDGYMALYQQQAVTGYAGWLRILSRFLVPGALLLLVGGRHQPRIRLLTGVLLLIYSSTAFFLGTRSTAVMPLLAWVWVWHRCVRRLPAWWLLGGGALLLFVVFPGVRMVRDMAGSARLSAAVYVDALTNLGNPATAIIEEMATTARTIGWTLQLVPWQRGYDLGASYFHALLTLMPNLFWEIHPSVARGLVGDWMTWQINPEFAAQGGGYGYSFIAEAWFNFGWLGGPVVLVFIGYLLGGLAARAGRSGATLDIALAATVLALVLLFARGESGSVVRNLGWFAVLPCLLAWGLSRSESRLLSGSPWLLLQRRYRRSRQA